MKNLLKKYNASVQILKEHGCSFSTLSWEEATDVTNSSSYNSVSQQCDHGPSMQDEMVPDAIKREIIDAYGLCQRAGEELGALYEEMSRVMGHFYEECLEMEQRKEVQERSPNISSALLVGLRSVLLRKIDFCQINLLFSVQSFKAFVAVSTDIEDYLKNSICINIPHHQLINEMVECDLIEEVKSPIPLEFIIDNEKDDYLFGDDKDSGFITVGELSIPPSQ